MTALNSSITKIQSGDGDALLRVVRQRTHPFHRQVPHSSGRIDLFYCDFCTSSIESYCNYYVDYGFPECHCCCIIIIKIIIIIIKKTNVINVT